MKTAERTVLCYDAVVQAGERLLMALAEERRISDLLRTDAVIRHKEAWMETRRKVDVLAKIYCAALDECGYPDVPIRHLVECDLGIQS